MRRVIPTATSEFILLYKDTALFAAVGLMELMMFAKSMVANTANMTPYVVAACFYLIVTLPLTRVITVFEKKLAASEGTTSAPPTKKKTKIFVGFGDDPNEPAPALVAENATNTLITPDKRRRGG